MLTPIEPQDHLDFKQKIDSFLNLLKIYQKVDLPQETQKKATFIIAENNDFGVYGGAVLYPKKVELLYNKITHLLLRFAPKLEEVWFLKLCFSMEPKEGYLTSDILDLYESFYQNLHKLLQRWGHKKKTTFLVLSLGYKEYCDSKTYGSWPYLLEIPPMEAPDHRFHGLLLLNKQKDLSYEEAGARLYPANDQKPLNRMVQ